MLYEMFNWVVPVASLRLCRDTATWMCKAEICASPHMYAQCFTMLVEVLGLRLRELLQHLRCPVRPGHTELLTHQGLRMMPTASMSNHHLSLRTYLSNVLPTCAGP